MPFARPTLTQIVSRVEADIETRIPGADARLRRSNLNVLARVHSAGAHGLYGFLDFTARQVIYDTAEAEVLERWASIWSISRIAATYAEGSVTLTGTNGAVIPAGTLLQRPDAAEFTTTADATIAGGTATAAVIASVAGVAGNSDAGAQLSLVTPIVGVNSTGVAAAGGISGGVDTEGDDNLRERLLRRVQTPPHGGSASDYVTWALEVAGVTRAWVSPNHVGAGTVGVYFVMDNKEGTPIPDAGEVDAVQAYIEERRPVTAEGFVMSPTPVALNFTIALTPNTEAAKAAVEAELRDLLLREAEPGATILISHIREAISLAAGEGDHVLTVPAANVTHAAGEIAVFGAITWA